MMKVWITKYALTRGVVLAEGGRSAYTEGVVVVKWPGGMNGAASFFGDDWHTSEEAARARVKQMISDKRKSLAKQLAKLDTLAKWKWESRVEDVTGDEK